MATTVEIDEVMNNNQATRDWYGGTYALDEAVKQLHRNDGRYRRCYVVNS